MGGLISSMGGLISSRTIRTNVMGGLIRTNAIKAI